METSPLTRAVGVIFDLDGVILDSEGLQFRAYSEVLAAFGVTVSAAEFGREWVTKGCGPEHAVATYALPVAADDLRARKNPVYHRMLRESARLMPGAEAALDRLHRRYPLALATNSNAADTNFVLEHFALRRYFTAVVTRECYREPKPAPDAFATAAGAIARAPASCVVIEDAYKGLMAAVRAGCACIAVPNEFTRSGDFSRARRVVGSLAEVTPELIEEVLG